MIIRQPLQAVLFDLDGTLRHNRPRAIDIFLRLVGEEGVAADRAARRAAERWQHAYWAGSPELKDDLAQARGFADPAFWLCYTRRHLRVLGAPEDRLETLAETVYRRMLEEYQPQGYQAPQAADVLAELARRGLRLGLVSNRDDPFDGELGELGLDGFFELTLAAGEVGYWKPDGRLLQHAAQRMGIEPARAVYVGDNWYADVGAAEAAGMWPVLVDPQGLFPEADCPVVSQLGELLPLLDGLGPAD